MIFANLGVLELGIDINWAMKVWVDQCGKFSLKMNLPFGKLSHSTPVSAAKPTFEAFFSCCTPPNFSNSEVTRILSPSCTPH